MIFFKNLRVVSWAVLFLIVAAYSVQAQTKTNIEIFKELVAQSIVKIFQNDAELPKDVYVNLKLGETYNIFEDQIYQSIKVQNKNVVSVFNPATSFELSYTLENAEINYGEIFRDGFLGEHYLPRKIFISGSYRLTQTDMLNEDFYYESLDTIKYDEIQAIENLSYPFTKGEIPSEPAFSNLFEPVIAITTAAIIITLFFTIRSK